MSGSGIILSLMRGHSRRPIRKVALSVSALVLGAAVVWSGALAASYDIKAELMFYPSLSAYVVQIRNIGPTIPGPTQGRFWLAIPTGTKITSWILNGWQCAPSPPVSGSTTIACTIAISAGWTAGTILSNQLFYAAFQPGIKPGRVCIRSLALKLSQSSGYQPIAETSTANNSLCV
jgi:hypothetical protein